jgi:hypothetical protein
MAEEVLNSAPVASKKDPAQLSPEEVAAPLHSLHELTGFAERHYSVAEIAQMWSLSQDFVRRLFEREPGVLVLGQERTRYGKRRYRTLRIPKSVVERVHRRLCKC